MALFPGDSEFYAALKASVELLGLVSMMRDLWWRFHGEVRGDENASGIFNSNGFGKARHIDTGLLCIQQVAAEQRLKFKKVLGIEDPADLLTQYSRKTTNFHHTANLAHHVAGGRFDDAVRLHVINVSTDDCNFAGKYS